MSAFSASRVTGDVGTPPVIHLDGIAPIELMPIVGSSSRAVGRGPALVSPGALSDSGGRGFPKWTKLTAWPMPGFFS